MFMYTFIVLYKCRLWIVSTAVRRKKVYINVFSWFFYRRTPYTAPLYFRLILFFFLLKINITQSFFVLHRYILYCTSFLYSLTMQRSISRDLREQRVQRLLLYTSYSSSSFFFWEAERVQRVRERERLIVALCDYSSLFCVLETCVEDSVFLFSILLGWGWKFWSGFDKRFKWNDEMTCLLNIIGLRKLLVKKLCVICNLD